MSGISIWKIISQFIRRINGQICWVKHVARHGLLAPFKANKCLMRLANTERSVAKLDTTTSSNFVLNFNSMQMSTWFNFKLKMQLEVNSVPSFTNGEMFQRVASAIRGSGRVVCCGTLRSSIKTSCICVMAAACAMENQRKEKQEWEEQDTKRWRSKKATGQHVDMWKVPWPPRRRWTLWS